MVTVLRVCHSMCVSKYMLRVLCVIINVCDYGQDVDTAASDVFFHCVHKMDSRLYTVPPWKKHAKKSNYSNTHTHTHTYVHTTHADSLQKQKTERGADVLTWSQLAADTPLDCIAGTHSCFHSKCAPRWLDWAQSQVNISRRCISAYSLFAKRSNAHSRWAVTMAGSKPDSSPTGPGAAAVWTPCSPTTILSQHVGCDLHAVAFVAML